jgi:hypothetical protein
MSWKNGLEYYEDDGKIESAVECSWCGNHVEMGDDFFMFDMRLTLDVELLTRTEPGTPCFCGKGCWERDMMRRNKC